MERHLVVARFLVLASSLAPPAAADLARRQSHAAPQGAFGGFLKPAEQAPVSSPPFVAMADLTPRLPAKALREESEAEAAWRGFEALSRQFHDAAVGDRATRAIFARPKATAFAPCHRRIAVDGNPEAVFESTPGLALVVGAVPTGGGVAAHLVRDPSLVPLLLEEGPRRATAWEGLRQRVREGAADVRALPLTTTVADVAFGPIVETSADGKVETRRETRFSLRGPPTDLIALTTTVETGTDKKTQRVTQRRIEEYCR